MASLYLRVAKSLLAGGYVCFGVFRIYNDQCLNELHSAICKVMSVIPVRTLDTRLKLGRSYFGCASVLIGEHVEFIDEIVVQIQFLRIIESLTYGVRSGGKQKCFLCH